VLGFVGPVALRGIAAYLVDRSREGYAPPAEPTLRAVMADGWVLPRPGRRGLDEAALRGKEWGVRPV